MRKPAFRICKSKDADQLCGNRAADQRLCFGYIDSTIPLLPQALASLCGCTAGHYANTPMQYTAIFHGCKNVNFQMKNFHIFLIFAQNIDCGYSLEPPQ